MESSKKVANEYMCSTCDYITSRKSSYDKHLTTSKHKMLINCCTKVAKDYTCLICDYHTCRKHNFDKHFTTAKHKLIENGKKVAESSNKVAESSNKVANGIFVCDICNNKTYKSITGLWKHKKMCSLVFNTNTTCEDNDSYKEEKELSDKELVMYLLKENSEFKNMIMKLVENGINHDNNHHNTNTMNTITNTTTTNINNNNNKTFNLQVFLNETCKDAMNISDFMESLQPQLSDLESIGRLGFVEGISKIIIKGLKALDETERPIHCTDKKRETVYVKDENKWEKEDNNKTRLRKAIKYVANENIMLLPQWKAKHPDYLDSSSDCSDKYNNIIIEVLGGDDDSNTSENKIIRKIAKEFVIEK